MTQPESESSPLKATRAPRSCSGVVCRRAGRDEQVGAVERTVLAFRYGCGEGLDRRAGIAHARVGKPAHEQQGRRARDDGGELCERCLAQRLEGRSRLRCDRPGNCLVVRARDLTEEAVDGECPHGRSLAVGCSPLVDQIFTRPIPGGDAACLG